MNRLRVIQCVRAAFTGALLLSGGTVWASTGACLNSSGVRVSGCSAVDGEFTSFLTPANNDFSSPNVGTGYIYNPTLAAQGGSGWTFNSVGVAGGGVSNDNGALIYGSQWYAAAPPAGTQAAGLQQFSGSTTDASISQEISGFTVGNDYAVTFDIADRSWQGTPTGPGDAIEVMLGGQILGTFTPTSAAWTPVTTGMMAATATTMNLEFYSTSTGFLPSGEVDSLFTDVMIGDPTGAPEPVTLGLVGGGLIMLLGLRRWRRHRTAL